MTRGVEFFEGGIHFLDRKFGLNLSSTWMAALYFYSAAIQVEERFLHLGIRF